MHDLSRLNDLALLKVLGVITPQQEEEWQKLLKAFVEDSLLKALEEERLVTERIDPINLHNRLKKLQGKNIDKRIRRRSFLPWGIAAAILVLVGVAWCFMHRWGMNENISFPPVVKATLQWPGGSMNLEEMEEGKAYTAGVIQIARMRNQFFVVRETDKAAATKYELDVGGNEDVQVFFPDSTRDSDISQLRLIL